MINERLTGCIKKINSLQDHEKSELLQLMLKHYDGIDTEIFFKDMADKDHIILLYDQELLQLRGFSTLKILQIASVEEHICLFSGDTIIEPDYWGGTQLPRFWCAYINFIRKLHPRKNIYWMLIAKGYKTYRFLPVFFKNYFPCKDQALDKNPLKNMLDFYAKFYFNNRYDDCSHLIDQGKIKDRLKEGVADIDALCQQDPHIEYFLQCNPDWKMGVELASITQVGDDNLTQLGKRMFKLSQIINEDNIHV